MRRIKYCIAPFCLWTHPGPSNNVPVTLEAGRHLYFRSSSSMSLQRSAFLLEWEENYILCIHEGLIWHETQTEAHSCSWHERKVRLRTWDFWWRKSVSYGWLSDDLFEYTWEDTLQSTTYHITLLPSIVFCFSQILINQEEVRDLPATLSHGDIVPVTSPKIHLAFDF